MKKYKFVTLAFVLLIGGLLVWSFDSGQVNPLLMSGSVVSGFSLLRPDNFKEVIDQGWTVIDVRTPEEYQSGHLPGAINIDFYDSEFVSKLANLQRDGQYAVYCRSGNRSSLALEKMKEMNFTGVVDLAGGVEAWTESGNHICLNC